MSKIVIIGNGIAGITAARNIRKKSDAEITIISSESPFFFSRTALMYVYMGHMEFEDTIPYEASFWKKNRLELLFDEVILVKTEERVLKTKNGLQIGYDQLVIATGSKPRFLNWPGQHLKGVQGLYSKQDLDLLEENTKGIKTAVISGGGLIGIELAEMLLSRGITVHFLIRDELFWGSVLPRPDALMLMEHLKKHKSLCMHYKEELVEILGDNAGKVSGVKTKKGTTIQTEFLGITIGVAANIEFLKGSGIEVDKGIIVNNYLETNIPNIYAIGDCVQLKNPIEGRKAIEQVWYTGRMMGETVAKTLTGNRTSYNPGNWYNSAKFFDIEYQTYGQVNPTLRDDELDFVWQHKTKEILLHFVFEKNSKSILGVNAFGIRLRHELFDYWLTSGKTIEYVIQHLRSANFDPEFFQEVESEIIDAYNQKFHTNLRLTKTGWWQTLLNN